MDKLSLFLKPVLAICLVLAVVFLSARDWKPRDYLAWYAAGQIVRESPERLYDPELQHAKQAEAGMKDGFFPFVYPSFVAVPFAVLTLLPVTSFYFVLLALNLALLVVSLWLMISRFALEDRGKEALLLVASTAFAVYYNLIAGQLAFVSLLLITLFVSDVLSRKPSAGFWVGALIFKPTLMVLPFGFLLLRRDWGAIARAVVAAAAGVLLSVLLVGFSGLLENVWMIGQMSTHEVMRYMQNLRALSEYLGAGTTGWIVISGIVVLFLAAVVPFARPGKWLVSALLLATVLTSPQLHTYDLSILLVLLVLGFPTGAWYQRLYVLLGALPLLSIPFAFPVTPVVLLILFGFTVWKTGEEILTQGRTHKCS